MQDVLNVPAAKWRQDEEISIFSDAVGQFFERECKPHVESWRKQGYVPREMWKKAGEAGLLCASISDEYGGAGGDFRHEAVIIEQQQWKGIDGFGITLHNAIIAPYIEAYGSEEQKQKWLPGIAAGDYISSFALTEPEAGSDAGSLRTKAVRDGDHYVLNGAKRYITNANKAQVFTTMARTDPDTPGAKGVSAFIVDRDTPGITVGPPEKKMGQQGAHACDVIFEDVRVPAENMIGKEGEGFKVAMSVLDKGRLHISAVATGASERLIKEMVNYAMERKQFGKPIAQHQLIQAMMADSQAEAYAARAMILDAARRRDAGEDHAEDQPRRHPYQYFHGQGHLAPATRCRRHFGHGNLHHWLYDVSLTRDQGNPEKK